MHIARTVTALAFVLSPLRAESAFSVEVADCRSAVVAASTKYVGALFTPIAKCHSKRLSGDVPAATDCNDPDAAATALGKSLPASIFEGGPVWIRACGA